MSETQREGNDGVLQFVASHGMEPQTADELNKSLKAAIDSMPSSLYGSPNEELTEAELAILREGGIDLDLKSDDPHPVTAAAVQFGALLETSLTTAQAAERLGVQESQVRQMIVRGTLYSILLDSRRYIPRFQFLEGDGLVPNIGRVNAVLPEDLHPLDVVDWYTQPDPDLFRSDDADDTLSPVDWLRTGGSPKPVIDIARTL